MKKVFVLGRTGSGKSTTVRLLANEAQALGWELVAFNDYPFLFEMYSRNDGKRFRTTEHGGFEVLEPSLPVYEEAFRRLKRAIEEVEVHQTSYSRTIITIEFTSNNYFQALQLFGDDFLRDAHFLFLLADLPTCLDRVVKRALHPESPDDYFVPESVLLKHYPHPYMLLPGVAHRRYTLIPNLGNVDALREYVRSVALNLFNNAEAIFWPVAPALADSAV